LIALLVIILIICILLLIGNVILLSGFYDLYKRVRAMEDVLITKRDEDVSKHLQNVGRKGLK